ncbi:hypothetical protein ACOSQ3_009712 [Xanthoceras sorbifolium]
MQCILKRHCFGRNSHFKCLVTSREDESVRDRSPLQTHSRIGKERNLTTLYLKPIHDRITECLPSLQLRRKSSQCIY